jgi:hypothetical protein
MATGKYRLSLDKLPNKLGNGVLPSLVKISIVSNLPDKIFNSPNFWENNPKRIVGLN